MTSSTLPLPPNLVRKSGVQVSTEQVLEKTPVLALYFSAHWCPPCRQFTPVLAQTYKQAKDAGMADKVEVVFVSSDRSQGDMSSYMRESHGDWLALPHGSPEVSSLSSMFGVRGIPALVVVTRSGEVVARDGRSDVMSLGVSAFAQWNMSAPVNVDTSVVNMLKDNPDPVRDAAKEVLTKLLGNVINDPNNTKYRAIKLTNKVIEEKLLPASGAFEILFSVGFEEADDKLILPLGADLNIVKQFSEAVRNLDQNKQSTSAKTMSAQASSSSSSSAAAGTSVPSRPVVPVPSVPSTTNLLTNSLRNNEAEFLAKLSSCSTHIDAFENPTAQAAALSVIPVDKLKQQAQEKFDRAKSSDPSINPSLYRDMLLLEFKEWFKTDFFHWVDTPPCPRCGKPSQACGMGVPTPEEARDGAGRVELYKCDACNIKDIRFARYHSKPEKLLETRKGRCGEWANCFVLCCRALGFDTRHVLDWTDHVWAEVWSEAEDRWLHVDPGETVDKPLVYEAGWGKKLTYVIAFSKDEVQDVTWRYSKNHEETKNRRMLVRSKWLVGTVLNLTKQRMQRMGFNEEKKVSLTERRLAECLEMLTPRTVTSGDKVGRQTGSLAWRLARGELGVKTSNTEWSWKPSNSEVDSGVMTVSYDVVSDIYTHGDEVKEGFAAGLWSSDNVNRKVESDWNMVYIARNEGNCGQGEVEWKFVMREGYTIDRVILDVDSTCFKTGTVRWQLCSDSICLMPSPGVQLDTRQMAGTRHVSLHATLTGGEGDTAWQHTQLFRSTRTGSAAEKFTVKIYFKKE